MTEIRRLPILLLLSIVPLIVHADWWLYGGHANYSADPFRDTGYYAGLYAYVPNEPVDIEAALGWSTLAYKTEAVQNATAVSSLMYAIGPGGNDSENSVAAQAGNAPGFGGGTSSGGTGTGNGQTPGGIRVITVADLEQYDFTFAIGRALGSNYFRGGLHLVSANEAAIDGNYSGFLEWQYARPYDYFLRLGLAAGERLDGAIDANQFEITAGKELGNPVLGGLWQLQLAYLVGDNDWSGVGGYRAESVEASIAWSRGSWRLETSVWEGERMFSLLNRGYYLITQQDLLTGGYRLGAGYTTASGTWQLFYDVTQLEPAAQVESELSTIGLQFQRGIK